MSHNSSITAPASVQILQHHVSASYDVLVKIVMIGDSGVGKTSLLRRFSDGMFSPSFISTIGVDFEITTMKIDGKIAKVQIWDTAGQERFQNITASYYRGAHVIFLAVDVTDVNSFRNVHRWMEEVRTYASDNVPIVWVANKIDLVQHRVVSDTQIRDLALKYNISKYIFTSAKTNENVSEAFACATREYLVTGAWMKPKNDKILVNVIQHRNAMSAKNKLSSLLQCCRMM